MGKGEQNREKEPATFQVARADSASAANTYEVMITEVLRAQQIPAARTIGDRVAAKAHEQSLDLSADIFEAKTGRFRGVDIPKNLRCAIFQSNVADAADIIKPREVTVRALEFGDLIRRKGWTPQTFDPNKEYPNGTYLVGKGSLDGTNSRHVAIIYDGQIVHTKQGRVVREPIANKFAPGSYAEIKAYLPPRK